MSQLELKALGKIYNQKVEVLKDINLKIKSGEFVVLVGPSGCGKSTLLRMLAGLEDVSTGDILMDEKVVNFVPPSERNIAMVFQDYALYPHMTVAENLGFGLKMKKTPKAEIQKRISEAAEALNIMPLMDRKPAALSGGQRQRVAIGRAIVRQPAMFLFDEPLSNLDAKLRAQTRIEIASLHKRVKATMVYVTHDQVEAMTLADRIVVLNKGEIQQAGTPLELYHSPANIFVASFIGNPSMNFLKGTLSTVAGKRHFKLDTGEKMTDDVCFDFGHNQETKLPKKDGSYVLGVRPESFKVLATTGRESEGQKDCKLKVVMIEPHGHECHLIASLGGAQIILRTANPKRLAIIENSKIGDFLETSIDRDALHWFENTSSGLRVTDV